MESGKTRRADEEPRCNKATESLTMRGRENSIVTRGKTTTMQNALTRTTTPTTTHNDS